MRHRERGTRNHQPVQDLSDLDFVLDTLLAGGSLPDADQSGLQPVADLLIALRQPAVPAELTGQASALAEFRARPRRTAAVTWGRRGGPARGRWLRPRPATALAAGVVVVAGLAGGAYEGDLPAPVQRLWHNTIGLTAVQSKAPHRPAHPGPTGRTSPSPTLSPHHTHSPAQPAASQHGQQHGDSRPAADRDSHRSGDQPSQQNSSSPGHPSSSPSPSPPATPEPSTSPAAQPSPQSSSSTGPHHPDSSPSSSP